MATVKVEAIRRHDNPFPPQYRKNPGRHYVVPESEVSVLVASGLVRKVSAKKPAPPPPVDD